MNRLYLPWMILLIGLILAGLHGVLARPSQAPAGYLPDEVFLQDWVREGAVETYTPDNLFEYINGEAELFHDYNFQVVATAYYVHRDNQQQAFSVDIYTMGSPLDAFGIYSMYRQPNMQFESIGAEAMIASTALRFYKGRHFVQISTGVLDREVQKVLRQCAVMVAERIPEAELPESVNWLPQSNRVPHSLAYRTTGFLGQEAFTSVYQATYNLESGQCSGFVADFSSGGDANQAFQTLTASVRKNGTVISDSREDSFATFHGSLDFQGALYIRQYDRYIIGAIGFEDMSDAKILISNIQNAITPGG